MIRSSEKWGRNVLLFRTTDRKCRDQEQSFESSDAGVEKSGFIPDLQKHGSPCGFEGRRDPE